MPPGSGWIITGRIQKNTLRSYESVITAFCRDHGNRELEEFTVDLILAFLESITNGRKPAKSDSPTSRRYSISSTTI